MATVAGSGLKAENGIRVVDNNLRTKWVAKGKGESLWLGLAAPTIIDSVAIAFRKVGEWIRCGIVSNSARHTFFKCPAVCGICFAQQTGGSKQRQPIV